MKNIIMMIAGFTLFLLLFSLFEFYLAIRPIRLTSTLTPKNLSLHYEAVSFLTQDKILIKGWFIPSKEPQAKTLILLHGYPADKGDILPAMAFLHPEFNLLLFDFRYCGESGGHYSTVGKNEVLDLLAALKYLHTRDIHEVGVWGFSLGGAVALMTAPQAPAIKAIVAESAYAHLDWLAEEYYSIPLLRYPLIELTRLWAWLFLDYDLKQVSPAKAAEYLKIPIFIIHSRQDQVIPFKHAQALQKALQSNPKAEFLFRDQGAHGQFAPNYQKIIREFFGRNL